MSMLVSASVSLMQLNHQGVGGRCWFDYNSQDPSCSPYLGILRYLMRKKTSMPRSQGGLKWGGR